MLASLRTKSPKNAAKPGEFSSAMSVLHATGDAHVNPNCTSLTHSALTLTAGADSDDVSRTSEGEGGSRTISVVVLLF